MRAVGIEPTLLSEPDFESGASTSSTTPATGPHYSDGFFAVNCLMHILRANVALQMNFFWQTR